MIPCWVAEYVGFEFEEHGRGPAYDCWGLVRHILNARYGIAAPDYRSAYGHSRDSVGISAAFQNKSSEEWVKVSDAREGDVVFFRIAGKPMHCGLVVHPNLMIHIRKGAGSCIENYGHPNWRNRIEGFYRHRSLLGSG